MAILARPDQREKNRQRCTNRYRAKPELYSESCRAYREANKEVIRDRKQKAYARDRPKELARRHEYRHANRDKVREQNRGWRKANREKAAAAVARCISRYRETDPFYRANDALRARLNGFLKGRDSRSIIKLLGCSREELRSHLSSMFLPGMTWANYGLGVGKWHIDHWYPLAATTPGDDIHLLAVWNRENLRPAWGEENIRKGASVSPEARAVFDALCDRFRAAKL